MVLFNGDRVCIKDGDTLKFGRFQEYIEEKQQQQKQDFNDLLGGGDVLAPTTSYGNKVFKSSPPLRSALFTEESSSSPSSNDGATADDTPGLTSPMLMATKRRRPFSMELDSNGSTRPVKRQIVWDDNKGSMELKSWSNVENYKVIDRKFTIGQRVYKDGRRGQVTEIIPIATVKVHRIERNSSSSTKNPPVELITDLGLDDLQPISPLFNGVNIEYNGWIGQIVETHRSVTYRLSYPLQGRETYQWSFYDSLLLSANIRYRSQYYKNSIPSKSFAYPFLPQPFSNPYKGKVEKLSKAKLGKQFAQEDEEKENIRIESDDNKTATATATTPTTPVKASTELGASLLYNSPSTPTTSSSSPQSTRTPIRFSGGLSLPLRERKSYRPSKDQCIIGTVESVSVVGIKVRWTGKLPADLIKPAPIVKAKKGKGLSLFGFGRRNNKCNSTATTVAADEKEATVQKLPSTFICEEKDLKLVRPLYIHPAMFFDKKGLCLCSGKVYKDLAISEKRWADEMYKSLASTSKDVHHAPFDLNPIKLPPPPEAALRSLRKDSFIQDAGDDCSGKTEKLKRIGNSNAAVVVEDGDEQKAGENDVIVCKHFVRHMYKVIWERSDINRKSWTPKGGGDEEEEVGLYYGNQLEPDVNQVHKLCLGLIHSHLYVVAKEGSWMNGKWDYGVVIEKRSDDSVVVEWLRIQIDGNVVTERVLECSLVEIDKHPTFNELHEGRVVTRRKEAAKYEACKNFIFGTVVSVKRFSLGKISVYCPIQKKLISLWPHMLEVCPELSLQYLIANNIVGLKKPKEGEGILNVAQQQQQTSTTAFH